MPYSLEKWHTSLKMDPLQQTFIKDKNDKPKKAWPIACSAIAVVCQAPAQLIGGGLGLAGGSAVAIAVALTAKVTGGKVELSKEILKYGAKGASLGVLGVSLILFPISLFAYGMARASFSEKNEKNMALARTNLMVSVLVRAMEQGAVKQPSSSSNQAASQTPQQTESHLVQQQGVEPKQGLNQTSTNEVNVTNVKKRDDVSEPAEKLSFNELVCKSKEFENNFIHFRTTNNRIEKVAGKDLIKQQKIAEFAAETRPILTEETLDLMKKFLDHKKDHGTQVEKKLYKEMSAEELISRLLTKRPFTFYNSFDTSTLRDGTHTNGGFETIGKDDEKAPLTLEEYISYDEMRLSALIGVATPTFFINDGSRTNEGKKGVEGSFQEEGIYVGVVGPRLEKPNCMEYKHLVVSPLQNTEALGYGRNGKPNPDLALWAEFYGEGSEEKSHFPSYEEAKKDKENFIGLGNGLFLNKRAYKKRLKLVIKPFLLEANARAEKANKKAYVPMVGLGLGVWAINSSTQTPIYLDAIAEVVKECDLKQIAHIDFQYLSTAPQKENQIKEALLKENIECSFSKNTPAMKLYDPNLLTVACYAWDGNSLPGNEYWDGALAASGDPAAACCSLIAELQNPYINPSVTGKKAVFYP